MRFGRPPVQPVPLVLDHNRRNTQQIHEAFGPLAPSRMYSRGGEGPESRPRLPAHHRSTPSVQVERTDYHDQAGHWSTFFDEDDVFYGHVLVVVGDPDVIRAMGDDVARRLGIM